MLSNLFARTLRFAGALAAVTAFLLSLGTAELRAQQGTISGEVLDASNLDALVGAQVFIPDSDYGALTDGEGRYRITGVPPGSYELQFRMIGYRVESRPVEVAAGQTVTVDAELAVSAVNLEGLVVTATGQQRRREVGNAISTVDAAQAVERSQVNTLTNLLQGRSTGVSVQRSSGSLGTASSIKIRGSSSISLDNTPLVYVDGARINNTNTDLDQTRGFFVGGQEITRLNDINPGDIESIEVVKGPAAATLYGTEAAGGVIRITTKQGRMGGGATYTGRAQFMTNDNAIDMPSILYVAANDGFASGNTYAFNVLNDGTAGLESPFRTGTGQSLGGTVRGGLDDVSYFLSAEWDDEEGNLPQNDIQRWNGRANFSIDPSDKVSINVSNGFTSSLTSLPNNDNNGAGYLGVYYLGNPGVLPIMRSDPNGGGSAIETCPVAFELALADGTPLADATAAACSPSPYRGAFFGGTAAWQDIATLVTEQQIERYIGSATVTYRPFEMWTNRFTVGYDQFADDVTIITPVDPAEPFGSASLGALLRDSRTNKNLTLEASSTIDVEVTGDFTSSTTVGAQWFKSIEEATQASGQEFPAGSPAIGNSVTNTGGDFFVETRTLGVFVQEQLGWRDRLFVTPAVRWDDNSAFGRELDVQAYPRVSATYNFGPDEGLPAFVSALKLRAAWGQSGKQPPTDAAIPLLFSSPTTLDGVSRLGVFPNRPGNDVLKPERGEEIEVGFDLGALEDRLALEFTYYDQTTKDAIVTRPLSPSVGFPAAQFTNVGEIVNHGFEIGVDGRAIQAADLTLDLGLNVTTNDNEITQLENPIIFGLGGTTQRHEQGLPFASYKQRAITVENGAAVISDTAVFHGQPTPEWEGSFSATMSLFQRVTLYGLLDFAAGHQQFDNTGFFSCLFGNCPEIYDRDANGDLTDQALIYRAAVANNVRSPFFVDADYAKIRSASVRFEIPETWIDVLGIRGASFTVAGENLATFTSYRGLDPEINFAGGANASNADFFTVPPSRRFTAALSVSF